VASPQLENGYLRLSNELAEALARTPLSGSQFRVMLTVAREAYGRNGGRKLAPLSLPEIAKRTRLELRGVRREVKELLRANVLFRQGEPGERCSYGLQKNYDAWAFGEVAQGQLSPGTTLPGGNSPSEPRDGSPWEPRDNAPCHKKKTEERKKAAQGEKHPSPLVFAGRHLKVTEAQDRMLADAFPWVDRQAEYAKMDAWLEVNPAKRPKNQGRFAYNWVSKVPPPGVKNASDQRFGKPSGAVHGDTAKYSHRKPDIIVEV